MITIVDIDDTIVKNFTEPIPSMIEYVNRLPGEVYIVTGRPKSDRLRTAQLLKDIKVKHSVLIMNPYSTRYSNKHKAEIAHLLRNRVSLAIDDNPNARAGYASVGIEVIDPVPMYTPKI